MMLNLSNAPLIEHELTNQITMTGCGHYRNRPIDAPHMKLKSFPLTRRFLQTARS